MNKQPLAAGRLAEAVLREHDDAWSLRILLERRPTPGDSPGGDEWRSATDTMVRLCARARIKRRAALKAFRQARLEEPPPAERGD